MCLKDILDEEAKVDVGDQNPCGVGDQSPCGQKLAVVVERPEGLKWCYY